ncbi:MAG: hypothetical protein ACLQVD_16155, partial [Capsulimonadaceae bacterium]
SGPMPIACGDTVDGTLTAASPTSTAADEYTFPGEAGWTPRPAPSPGTRSACSAPGPLHP